MKSEIKMAIIRPVPCPISRNLYNSQEIGLARGLSLQGVNVDVYVAGRGPRVECQPVAAPGAGMVRLFELPFLRIPQIDQGIYYNLRSVLDKENYSFIQVNEENELTSFLVARFARRRGIPVVIYQGMYYQLTGRILSTFQRCYDRLLLPLLQNNISMALVKTTRAGDHLKRKGFSRIRVLPVGLDPTPFIAPVDRNWRKEFCIPLESPILLYVGNLVRNRNIDLMLDVAKLVRETGAAVVIAGSGPEEKRIAARISDEGISNARLVGGVLQQSLPSLYRESALFLLPSNFEIYGMVVLEAMYFGVPVLSTRTAGPEDIIENGVDGILMDGLQSRQWAETIVTLLVEKEKREAMMEAALEKARNQLLWERIASLYYQDIIIPLMKSGRSVLIDGSVPVAEGGMENEC